MHNVGLFKIEQICMQIFKQMFPAVNPVACLKTVFMFFGPFTTQCYQSYLHSMVHSHQAYQQQATEGQSQSYPNNALDHTVPESYSEPGGVGHSTQTEASTHGQFCYLLCLRYRLSPWQPIAGLLYNQ